VSADLAIAERSSFKVRHLRWYIAGLLVLATTISYLDRQTLAVAVTSKSLNLPDETYAVIQWAFLVALAIMQPVAGRLIDRVGVRYGYALAVLFWSLANIAHAFATGVRSFASLRFLLGAGEAGNYPGAMKAIAGWFPARERALATGIFNTGSGTGAIIAPPLVAAIILMFNWQTAFVFTGAVGLVWVIAWLLLYREPRQHSMLTPAELELITSGQEVQPLDATKATWGEVLRHKEMWAVILAKFLTDPGWYFYLLWLPKYLKTAHGFDLAAIALFAWVPYVCADVGSVLGGVLSTAFSRWGLSTLNARKLALCICAAVLPVTILGGQVTSPYAAMGFICLATFGHQCWSANLLVMPADLFPRRMVGSACGLAGMCGILGAACFTLIVGFLLKTVGYGMIFTIVGLLYPTAAVLFMLLVWDRHVGGPEDRLQAGCA
jgi:ACS family hexuronate transporter-like MFS transporter